MVLGAPVLRRHIAAYADDKLAGLSEAQLVANPALATLRSQLATTCGMHSFPSSFPAPHRQASCAGAAATASAMPVAPPPPAEQPAAREAGALLNSDDPRVDAALRRLEDERRRRQRDRRDGRACRGLGGAGSSHAQASVANATPAAHEGVKPSYVAVADEAAAPPAHGNARHVRTHSDPPRIDEGSPPPIHRLASDWAGDAFRQSRGVFYGRRAARQSEEGRDGNEVLSARGGELSPREPRGGGPFMLTARVPDEWERDANDANGMCSAPLQQEVVGATLQQDRLDRIIDGMPSPRHLSEAMPPSPMNVVASAAAPSLLASTKDAFFDFGNADLFDISDGEINLSAAATWRDAWHGAHADGYQTEQESAAASMRALPPTNWEGALGGGENAAGAANAVPSDREMEAALMGLSAKERVLAKKELRKRQEEAAREGDLAAARHRYFQERVLADNAQRSQYLGSGTSSARGGSYL